MRPNPSYRARASKSNKEFLQSVVDFFHLIYQPWSDYMLVKKIKKIKMDRSGQKMSANKNRYVFGVRGTSCHVYSAAGLIAPEDSGSPAFPWTPQIPVTGLLIVFFISLPRPSLCVLTRFCESLHVLFTLISPALWHTILLLISKHSSVW